MRGFIPSGEVSGHARARVVEHELDMKRFRRREPAGLAIIRQFLRWLTPGGKALGGTPMRAIDRELEEVWPSGSHQS